MMEGKIIEGSENIKSKKWLKDCTIEEIINKENLNLTSLLIEAELYSQIVELMKNFAKDAIYEVMCSSFEIKGLPSEYISPDECITEMKIIDELR